METYPEESANNARKALEWLVKNMLRMKQVPMDEAVRYGFLVPYKTLACHSKIMETGIKWDNLLEEQQERLMKYLAASRTAHHGQNRCYCFNYLHVFAPLSNEKRSFFTFVNLVFVPFF